MALNCATYPNSAAGSTGDGEHVQSGSLNVRGRSSGWVAENGDLIGARWATVGGTTVVSCKRMLELRHAGTGFDLRS